jgi:glycine cleavage system transcriptional repressor
MRHFAVSAIGRDRPGIVAALSGVLLEHDGNIEDSHMTILRGRFTVMLVFSTADDVETERLRGGLQGAAAELGLDAVSMSEVTAAAPIAESTSSHSVSVHGADHPGIVHAVTSALAASEINITDLETRVVGGGDEPLYAMTMEIAIPHGMPVEAVESLLRPVRDEQGIELSIRPLED